MHHNSTCVKNEPDEIVSNQCINENELDSLSFKNSILRLHNETEVKDMDEGNLEDPENGNRGEGNEERPTWSNKIQYILAQVGFSVGLGNVWRFPYMCHKNGGGAYLLPYVILLVVIGIPLFFLELAVGQRIRRGSIGVWNYISPRLGGIGIASCVVCFFVALYYNIIIGWSLWYFSQSFQQPLPWNECPLVENGTTTYVVPECEKSSATTYYWYREVLEISDSISESGGIKWQMMLCLLGAWVLVGLGMIKGIQSSGKVMYFSSLFPYLVLICFLVRALLLKGSVDGIVYMFTPKLEVMLDPIVWRDAATQVFFALSLGFGGIIAYSSYNKSKNNCQFDAFLVTLIDFFTSVLAALVVFAVLGFKANITIDKCVKINSNRIVGYLGKEVNASLIPQNINVSYMSTEDYHKLTTIIRGQMMDNYSRLGLDKCEIKEELSKAVQGTGLAFIAFTEAMTHFPASPFWSVMFFLMLVNLGLGSMFGLIQGIITPLVDTFKVRKEYLTVGCCLIAFAIGLIFVQRSGNYFVAMFDDYSATMPLMIVALLENVAVAWVYGTDRFFRDLTDMLGFTPYRYFYYMWKFITPTLMIILLSAGAYQMGRTTPTYSAWNRELVQEQSLIYPPWGLAICISLIIIAILPVPLVFVLRFFKCCVAKADSMSTINDNKRNVTESDCRTGQEEEDDFNVFQGNTPSDSPAPISLESINHKQSSSTAQTESGTNGHSSTTVVLVHTPKMPVSHL